MSYQALDRDAVLTYALSVPPLRGMFPAVDRVTTREIGDGNLNQVFVLEDDDGHGVIVKQALPYLRVAGEAWPLTRDRILFETRALELYGQQTPSFVPAVLHANGEMSLVAMTYLRAHRVLRASLTSGSETPALGVAVGTFMARTHFLNSDLHLVGEEKKARQADFHNPHLCRLQEDFVYTNPFMSSDENDSSGLPPEVAAAIRADAELKSAVLRTKLDYLTHAQTLLHGDLHTGSIMVHDADVRIIDPEFAFYGPAAYDVGTFLAHLAIAAVAARFHAADADDLERRHAYLLATFRDTWTTYRDVTHALWRDGLGRGVAPDTFWHVPAADDVRRRWLDLYLDEIGGASARHGGCEILRRLLGIVTTGELSAIADLPARHAIETDVAALARRWLLTPGPEANVETMLANLNALLAQPRRT